MSRAADGLTELGGRPRSITIDRQAAELRIVWADGVLDAFPLRWLRANCPCATCREARRTAELEQDPLRLATGPAPSTEIAGAELVGNYAVRLDWTDGHTTGIYAFSALRHAGRLAGADPGALPPLLPD